MDATAPQLTDIKFNEAKRGYDPVEVDNFLEKLGDAVIKLEDKMREANRRADDAERRVGEAQRAASSAEKRALDAEARVAVGGGSADEDELAETLKKTLLLAQRTADETVKEAKAEAATLTGEAEQKAARLLEDANRAAAKKLAAVEDEIGSRRASETSDLEAQVKRLEDVRVKLVADVEALEAHLDEVRVRIRAGADLLIEVLDDRDRLHPPERPTLAAPPVETIVGDAAAGTAPTSDRPGTTTASRPPAAGSTTPPVVKAKAKAQGAAPGRTTSDDDESAKVAKVAKPDASSPQNDAPTGAGAGSPEGSVPGASSDTGARRPKVAPVIPPVGGRQGASTADRSGGAAPGAPSDRRGGAAPGAAGGKTGSRTPASEPTSDEASARLFPSQPPTGGDDDPARGSKGAPGADPAGPSTPRAGTTAPETSVPPSDAKGGSREPSPGASAPAPRDDGFLDELRKAADDDPLGPMDADADAAMQAFFTEDDEDLPRRPRFGRRR